MTQGPFPCQGRQSESVSGCMSAAQSYVRISAKVASDPLPSFLGRSQGEASAPATPRCLTFTHSLTNRVSVPPLRVLRVFRPTATASSSHGTTCAEITSSASYCDTAPLPRPGPTWRASATREGSSLVTPKNFCHRKRNGQGVQKLETEDRQSFDALLGGQWYVFVSRRSVVKRLKRRE